MPSTNELQDAFDALKGKLLKHWGQIPSEIVQEVNGLERIVNDLLLKDNPEPPAPDVVPGPESA